MQELPFYIKVPKTILPVHSLDVVGTILDMKKLGERSLQVFQEWAELNMADGRDDAKIIADYKAFLEGKPEAKARKGEIIRALQGPLNDAGVPITYTRDILLSDGVATMEYMVGHGHGFLLHSTESIHGLVDLLPTEAKQGLQVYHKSDKSKPEAFVATYDLMHERGARIVSHSEDDLAALVAASQAGHFQAENGLLVFVNRNDREKPETVLGKGIHMYVNKLTEVPYADLVK